MSMPSPFELGRETANRINEGVSQNRDRDVIGRVLQHAMSPENAGFLENNIGEILMNISPENRQFAAQIFQNQNEKLKQKQAQNIRGINNSSTQNIPNNNMQINPTQGMQNAPSNSTQQPMQNTNEQEYQSSIDKVFKLRSAGLDKEANDEMNILKQQKTQQLGEKKIAAIKSVGEQKSIDRSYEYQKDFINDTTSSYKAFKTEMEPRLKQMQKLNNDDLISPSSAAVLEKLGIPLGVLENPSNELYNKLSQDLLKGLPETFGTRILKVEVENFLRTIPQLINSPDGRRMIASNMLKLGEMKEAYYNEMRSQLGDYIENDKKIPKDFQQNVFDSVLPKLQNISDEFVQLSEIKSVPPGTVPFFSPNGTIQFVDDNPEALQWAQENQGRRIW